MDKIVEEAHSTECVLPENIRNIQLYVMASKEVTNGCYHDYKQQKLQVVKQYLKWYILTKHLQKV